MLHTNISNYQQVHIYTNRFLELLLRALGSKYFHTTLKYLACGSKYFEVVGPHVGPVISEGSKYFSTTLK